MFHCNGWGMPYAVTGMGGTHVVLRKVDGEAILRRIEDEGVTLLCGAPAVVNAIIDAATARRDTGVAVPGRATVRIVVAGAPPPSRTIERVEQELGWEFIQIYGLTETAPLLTVNRAPAEWADLAPAERARRLARAGVPAIGVRMHVDEDGELLARSNHVFAGYWDQPEETERALAGGWFHTGDGGELDGPYTVIADREEGRFHHHQRGECPVHRGGGLPLPAPGRGGGGGDRHPRRHLGRVDPGPGGPARRPRRRARRADRPLPRPHGALQGAAPGGPFKAPWPARPR